MNINIKDQEIAVNGIVYVPKEKTLQGELIEAAIAKGFKQGCRYRNLDGEVFRAVKDPYLFDEELQYVAMGDGDGLIFDGKRWAEILPDKKPLPKSRKEFIGMLTNWLNGDKNGFVFTNSTRQQWPNEINRFLDQYDFND